MARRSACVLAVLLASIAGSSVGLSQPVDARAGAAAVRRDGQVDAPIRKITLYRSGVGYFERSGSVRGDAEVQLRFPTEQINDILKSMVLLDLGGGKIEAVSYGSKEPLGRRLASFGVDISQNPSIAALLDQLRGAPIRLTAAGETVAGTILGIEHRDVQAIKDAPVIKAPFVNVLAGGAIRSVAISSVTAFELQDKELAAELEKALAALAEYRADRSKTVDIRFGAGGSSGDRQVVVGYIHEMPVWKASYRLVLPDENPKADAKARSMALQGWAIVENNTDQDWENVRLSLVSGRPVSFQMDLYEPLFVARPLVPVPTIPGVAPRAYQAGQDKYFGLATGAPAPALRVRKAEEKERADRAYDAYGAMPGGGGGGDHRMVAGRSVLRLAEAADYKDVSAADMADYGAAAQAQAGEVGEVFQYELESPVTIERQKSAMLPILAAPISGRRVSIFNMGDGSEHPMRGVEITNDASLQLLPGPIAVFDGSGGKSAYAGDAQIGHISPGDKRLLAYAVDLDVDALTNVVADSRITKIRILQGAFEQTSTVRQSVSYAFQNKDAKRARTIVIEHPRLPGYSLVGDTKATETTTTFYRFETPIEPGKTAALTATQEQVVSNTLGVLDSYSLDQLVEFRKNGQLSEGVLSAFKDISARRAVIAGAERTIAELDRQLAEIAKDQQRIRENIGQIDRNSQLYTRYMTKLTEQETELERLDASRKKEQGSLDKLRADFDAFLRALNVE
jgi:hypothetical protein